MGKTQMAAGDNAIQTRLQAVAITVFLGSLFYANYVMWQNYIQVVLWACLLSQALHPLKTAAVQWVEQARAGEEPLSGKLARYGTSLVSSAQLRTPQFLVEHGFVGFCLALIFMALFELVGFYTTFTYLLVAGVLFLLAVKIFDRRLVTWWQSLGLSDDFFISLCINFGSIMLLLFILSYLGIKSIMEGVYAVSHSYTWMTHYVANYKMGEEDAESFNHATKLAFNSFAKWSAPYHNRPWWPAVQNIEDAVTERSNMTQAFLNSTNILRGLYAEEEWWPWVERVVDKGVQNMGGTGESWAVRAQSLASVANDTELLMTAFNRIALSFSRPEKLLINVFSYVTSFFTAAGDMNTQIVAFFMLLIQFTTLESTLLDVLIDVLTPFNQAQQAKLKKDMQDAMTAVFVMPFLRASLYALLTLLTFSVWDMKFYMLATLLSFILSLTPLIPPFMVPLLWTGLRFLPSIIGRSTSYWEFVKFAVLLVVHYFGLDAIENAVLKFSKSTLVRDQPGLTLFTAILGYQLLGLQGLILGPLAHYCLLVTLQSLHQGNASQPPKAAPSEAPQKPPAAAKNQDDNGETLEEEISTRRLRSRANLTHI